MSRARALVFGGLIACLGACSKKPSLDGAWQETTLPCAIAQKTNLNENTLIPLKVSGSLIEIKGQEVMFSLGGSCDQKLKGSIDISDESLSMSQLKLLTSTCTAQTKPQSDLKFRFRLGSKALFLESPSSCALFLKKVKN
jgi:hypothetical protein